MLTMTDDFVISGTAYSLDVLVSGMIDNLCFVFLFFNFTILYLQRGFAIGIIHSLDYHFVFFPFGCYGMLLLC